MTVEELYAEINGDYEDLVKRLPKTDLIGKFLEKYIESNDMNEMVQAYKTENYRQVFENSHNLKGMSINLGLTDISKNLSEICEAVRNGNPEKDISALIEQAVADNNRLVELVAKLGE